MVYTTENLQDDDRQSERSGVLLSSARGAARISETPRGGTAGLFLGWLLKLVASPPSGCLSPHRCVAMAAVCSSECTASVLACTALNTLAPNDNTERCGRGSRQ